MNTIVTGAAGFIGSNLIKALNEIGITNIIAVDDLSFSGKFNNLVDCEINDYLDKQYFIERLRKNQFKGKVENVFHLGACSNTLETDGRYVMENNYRYSMQVLEWCINKSTPLLYASSAAVYGACSVFKEKREFESPINIYGYSKYLFDQEIRRQCGSSKSQLVGLRYFNVYGQRENHKKSMASVAFQHFSQFRAENKVRLFEGSHGLSNGEQKRDFVYIDDVISANMWFLKHPEKSGIFNIGTGQAQSFNDVAVAVINAYQELSGEPQLSLNELQLRGIIEYIPFPESLKSKYQPFTQADISALRATGYEKPFFSLTEGIFKYIRSLLEASVV